MRFISTLQALSLVVPVLSGAQTPAPSEAAIDTLTRHNGGTMRFMGTMRFILMLCMAALVSTTRAAAQADSLPEWPVAAGSRVRIVSPVFGKRYVTGEVVAATRDTLLLRAARESTSTAIFTPSIVSLEIARGTHTNTARAGFGGFVLGTLVGAAIGAAASPPPCSNCLDFSQGAAALGSGLVGGVVGALVGAAIGKRPSDTWVPVAVPVR